MFVKLKRRIVLLALLFTAMIFIPLLAVGKSKNDIPAFFNWHTSGNTDETKNFSSNKTFCVLDESSGEILNIEDREFCYGAVTAEMPALFEMEALKAQTVACYTYFCRLRNSFSAQKDKQNKYEFTVNTQKWLNYVPQDQMKIKWGDNFEKYYSKIKEAVDSVFGEVLKEDGNLILAAYHAISSGKTEKSADVFGGDLKYLTNVQSPGDKLVPSYETKAEIPENDFKKSLTDAWNDCTLEGDPSKWIGEIIRSEGGMVKEITIGSHKAKGTDIRKIFGLRSADFELKYNPEENKFIFTVHGYGHGVGMSQYGAQYMAQQGADYKRILQWYYPNTNLCKI